MQKDKVLGGIMMVASIIVVILMFALFTRLDGSKSWFLLYLTYALIAFVMVYFTSDTVGLLYKFYEMPKPWQRFVPVINEFYMIDMKYRRVTWITFIAGTVFLILGKLPFGIKAIFGQTFATNSTFYFFLISFAFYALCQLVVGVGLLAATKDIGEEWERIAGCTLGMIAAYKIFAVFPIIRIFTFYGLRKPLDTLVTFNNKTISATQQVRVIEEDEE